MSVSSSEVARKPVLGTSTENTNAVTPIDITNATALVFPAVPQYLRGGSIECLLVIEGTANSRFTTNGVTPTASVGQLLVGGAELILRGMDVISAFRIIGPGNFITYQFYASDLG